MNSCVLVVDRPYNGDNYAVSISFKYMKELKLNHNSYVLVTGNDDKKIVCQVQKCDGKNDKALLNKVNRHNLGVYLNDAVTIQPCTEIPVGREVSIGLMSCNDNRGLSKEIFKEILRRHFKDSRRVLYENNKFIVRGGMRVLEFVVLSILPKPFCFVELDVTKVKFTNEIQSYEENEKPLSDVSYDDIGGFNGLLQQIRNSVEFPLRFPSLYLELNVESPKTIFYGPHGCGKVLTAQAIANETGASFILMNEKNTSGSVTERLQKIEILFRKAGAFSPSVLCIDGLDYFLPKEFATEEINIIGRTLMKLIMKLDKLQPVVSLIGIARDVQNVHPTIYDLFKNTNTIDRRFKFKIPDISGRIQILSIHTSKLNLANNFSITDLASMTADFTPSKLAYMCKKVAIRNKIIYDMTDDDNDETYLLLKQSLTNEDFKACLTD